MQRSDRVRFAALGAAFALALPALAARAQIGHPASPALVAAETDEILPDGRGLPPGRGSVARGQTLYETKCEMCHGAPIAPALFGGVGSLAKIPLKTVNSYWPAAPIVFDYIRRAMPPAKPGSLSADEIYALCAYVFAQDGLVPKNAVVTQATLPHILMPNRNGFVLVPQPDASAAPPPDGSRAPLANQSAAPHESRDGNAP